jgi:hypothetical protein
MRGLWKRAVRVAVVGAVLAMSVQAASVQTAGAAPPPDGDGGGVGILGIYALNSRPRFDPNTTVAWSIEWQVPRLDNGQEAWGAVGQWMFNMETGIYHAPGDGWWVYYYGDDNGYDGNNPDCTPIWGSGGACQAGGMGNLPVGQVVTFTYRRCTPYPGHVPDPAGSQLCVWVDMHDGRGERFLAEDDRTTVEMYAHDIETFGDSGFPEPIVPCSQPTVMRRQHIQTTTQPWQQLTGDQWDFQDTTDRYKFTNVDRTTGRWESCSDTNLARNRPATGSAPCGPDEGPEKAVNGSIGGGISDKFCTLATSKWLRVDLGSVRDVNRFVVQHAGAGGEWPGWNTRAYTIQLSQNGSSWTTPVTVTANTADSTTHDVTRRRARYVRLNVQTPTQAGDGAARIYELEIYNI